MEHFDWTSAVLFPYLNFFIFLGILIYAGRKPLRSLALKRREDYEALLSSARESQEKAQQKLAELNQRLQQLDAELASIRRNAEQEAAAEAKRLVQRGHELAEHLRKEAQRIGAAELLRAQQSLREEIIAQVRAEVESRMVQGMDREAQLQLVREKASKLPPIIARG